MPSLSDWHDHGHPVIDDETAGNRSVITSAHSSIAAGCFQVLDGRIPDVGCIINLEIDGNSRDGYVSIAPIVKGAVIVYIRSLNRKRNSFWADSSAAIAANTSALPS